MKRTVPQALGALFCGVVSATIAPAAQAEFKCEGRPLTEVDAGACAQAAQGADSLRRFVTRTESIYGLQMRDYIRFVGDEPPAKIASTPSKKPLARASGHVGPEHLQSQE